MVLYVSVHGTSLNQIKRELSTISINNVCSKKVCTDESVKRQERRDNKDEKN